MSELKSLQNFRVKRLVNIRRNRCDREREGRVLVVGDALCRELAVITPAHHLYLRNSWQLPTEIPSEAITTVSDLVFAKIAGLSTTEAIIGEFPLPRPRSLVGAQRLLALDGVGDPGNVGTLLRTALALGWEGAVFLEGCADPFCEKVMRASRGALFSLPYQRMDRQQLLEFAQREELTSYVAHVQGSPLCAEFAAEKILLVMGNEANGPSEEVRMAAHPITIPISAKMESLNVAAAGAILLHAFQKRW